ncbi:hypothetical protein [Umezawaea sp. Da 62-37]|uniref:hypothetical protein n=1 Tax=Umezawaea sp. Da 62-37 TaxID=3075927 RepID=UPI0028F6FA00|nr:hypothetical protein [Umezawaea sp. Da 62-37]WNV87931.1 hypothetical protein RM788_06495 [Umezawaea sp. Da 62-37]
MSSPNDVMETRWEQWFPHDLYAMPRTWPSAPTAMAPYDTLRDRYAGRTLAELRAGARREVAQDLDTVLGRVTTALRESEVDEERALLDQVTNDLTALSHCFAEHVDSAAGAVPDPDFGVPVDADSFVFDQGLGLDAGDSAARYNAVLADFRVGAASAESMAEAAADLLRASGSVDVDDLREQAELLRFSVRQTYEAAMELVRQQGSGTQFAFE